MKNVRRRSIALVVSLVTITAFTLSCAKPVCAEELSAPKTTKKGQTTKKRSSHLKSASGVEDCDADDRLEGDEDCEQCDD